MTAAAEAPAPGALAGQALQRPHIAPAAVLPLCLPPACLHGTHDPAPHQKVCEQGHQHTSKQCEYITEVALTLIIKQPKPFSPWAETVKLRTGDPGLGQLDHLEELTSIQSVMTV